MNNDDASVEQYRQRWEADDHWAMRRDFILRHRGAFSENRLLCLAQTFVNIELLGCRYPTEVVNLVQELAKDLKKSERPSLPKFARVAFVKAEDAVANDGSLCETSESKVTYSGISMQSSFGNFSRAGLGSAERKRTSEAPSEVACPPKVARENGSFGGATPAPSAVLPSSQGPVAGTNDLLQQPRFIELVRLIRQDAITGPNILDKLQQATMKSRLSLSCEFGTASAGKGGGAFECTVIIDGSSVATATALNKKEAKRVAYQRAWDSLGSGSSSASVSNCGAMASGVEATVAHQRTAGLNTAATSVPRAAQRSHSQQRQQPGNVGSYSVANLLEDGSGQLNLETFVLFENHNTSLDAASILHNSASANRLKCTFETSADESSFRCTVVLGQCEIGVALGTSKQEAKEAAAATSLNYLRGLVPTLRMKRLVDGCGPEVTKNRVGTSQAVQERISTENVGHRLLTMMGWTGGGVGKEGAGIVEPVMLKETSHRNGLGYAAPPGAKMSPGFKAKVVEVLREFSRTVVLQDLVFSPEFDNEERKYIHTVAHRFGLKSVSRGGQEGRFITVRHKLSARELVEEILRTGSTDKYEVVLPGQ
ncbi:CDKN2A-interacting protein [Ixodes scapularis]|uniref:CDKN2A-interacting protein n=1 Tax=Ixodes scapularis TaxID=6945 RepID=UPI001C38D214|nr:CDKN2A-interacting protein [Ixodes scapularis]